VRQHALPVAFHEQRYLINLSAFPCVVYTFISFIRLTLSSYCDRLNQFKHLLDGDWLQLERLYTALYIRVVNFRYWYKQCFTLSMWL